MSVDALIAAHAVEVVHAVTGRELRPLTAALVAPFWDGWRLLIRGHVVVLAMRASDAAQAPASTRIAISAPHDAALLADAGATTLELGRPEQLDQAVSARTRQLGLPPADAILELHLIDEHGLPYTGHEVAVVPLSPLNSPAASAAASPAAATAAKSKRSAKPAPAATSAAAVTSVALSEAAPGIYRSPSRRWGRDFLPFRITVDGRAVARREMDYFTTLTRLRLVVCHQPSNHSGA